MRFKGYVTATQAAERLCICRQTASAWAHRSLDTDDDDDDVKFPGTLQTAAGRLLIPVEAVDALRPRRRR